MTFSEWISVAAMVIGTVLGSDLLKTIWVTLHQEKKSEAKEETDEKKALKALCRNAIIDKGEELKSKGSTSLIEHENFEGLVDSYESLDGNGTVSKLVNEVYNLPLINE